MNQRNFPEFFPPKLDKFELLINGKFYNIEKTYIRDLLAKFTIFQKTTLNKT